MSKNTGNTAYRKLNVDAYDPEQYDENDESVDSPTAGPEERTIRDLISSNKLQDALHAALVSPPLKSRDQAVKDRATNLVAEVLQSFKSSDIEAAVQHLTIDEGDILLKYVYKAMEINPEAALCQSLLAWHSQIVAKFGHGCIIRVFSSRHRL